jgi:hypothetical protein
MGFGLLLVVPSAFSDELTPQKRADIRALLIENGIVEVTKDSFVNSMRHVDIFKGCAGCPSNAKDILTQVAAEVVTEKSTEAGQLIDQLVPLYSDTFTHQEILSWLAFVRSPIGKKIVANNIAMAQPLSAKSNAWIKTLQPVINQRTYAAFDKANAKNPR